MMTHEEASELLAVFALDAVAGDEYLQIEAHLAECPRCRAEVDAHREVAAALGNSVETLPEGLWLSIANQLPARPDQEPPPMPSLVRATPGEAGVAEDTFVVPAFTPPARGGRGRLIAIAALAAAAAVAAIALGVNLHHDDQRISNLQSALGTSGHSAVVAALHTPGHTLINVETAAHRRVAQFVMVPGGRGYLVHASLPKLSSNDTYQLWGITKGRSISLGLLGRAPNQATFTSAGSDAPRTLAITIEPAGGAVYPTGPMLATGTV